MHLRCGKKSASNRNNQEWDRLKFVPLLWQANVFPDHLKSPSVGIRRIGVFHSLPDDDEKPVTVQLVIEAADALLIAGGF